MSAFAALLVSAGLYAGSAADSMLVEGAFARAVPPGQANGAAFLTLTNLGEEDRALISAESEACDVVELHTHRMEAGVMRMRRVDRLDLPARSETKLEPGGLHFMLIGLQRQLLPGDEISMTLSFDDGSRRSLTMPVKRIRDPLGHDHH